MMYSAMVRVSYMDRGNHRQNTNLDVPIDGAQGLDRMYMTIAEAVREWGRVTGYRPYLWELGTIYTGKVQAFRGTVPLF